MQRKLGNPAKREKLLQTAIAQYRSPEQWLGDSALSFSAASYQPNKTEKTIRERLNDF